jgi:hypothetical protein
MIVTVFILIHFSINKIGTLYQEKRFSFDLDIRKSTNKTALPLFCDAGVVQRCQLDSVATNIVFNNQRKTKKFK